MSTKPETTFYLSVHKHLPPQVYKVKMSNPYTGGIPDCWYSGTANDLWVEYKFVKLPVRGDTNIDFGFSKLQLDWMNARFKEGRNVCAIIGCKEGGVVLRSGAWNREDVTKNEFMVALTSRKELALRIELFVMGEFNT